MNKPFKIQYALVYAGLVLAAILSGCASAPRPVTPTATAAESPSVVAPIGAVPALTEVVAPPVDIAAVPDAEPKVEAIPSGGPNKPYVVLGRDYTPMPKEAPYTERGVASWYGPGFHGRRTASGEVYNMYAMTAAHKTLPIPSYARVRNPANGREVVLRINDRGPFVGGRIVDLSYTAAVKLGLHPGIGRVEMQRITPDEIRTGAWRRDVASDSVRVADAGRSPGPASTAAAQTPAPAVASVAAAPAPEPPAASAEAAAVTPVLGPPADTAPVADGPTGRAYTAPGRGFWVQLGAFNRRDGAEGFHRRVSTEADWLAPLLAVFSDASLFRLQAGPYSSRDDARSVAERVRSVLQLVPMIVERR